MEYTVVGCLLLAGAFQIWSSRWYFAEHYNGRGVASVVLGVLAVLAIFTYVYPALTGGESEQLRVKLASATRDVAALKSIRQTLEADTKRLDAARAAAEAKLADDEKRNDQELDGFLVEIEDLRSRFVNSGLAIELAKQGSSEAQRKVDQVHAALTRLAAFKVSQPAPQPADPHPELSQLRTRMAAKVSTPSYDVEVYPDRELVRGRVGRYYIVDLKDAESGVKFYFDGGKYTLNASNQAFRSSLNSFIADVIQKFEGKVQYDLFVRGSADAKPYSGRLETDNAFRSVRYLRSLGDDKYGGSSIERPIETVVRNDDLPVLRAAFMQKVIADVYPIRPPQILEGSVTQKSDTRDRNAELIIFVDW